MDKLPNKWKKHLTLVEFGLKSKEALENEIHRFGFHQKEQLVGSIRNDMLSHPKSGFYIVSFIPNLDCFKLPNFCVHTKEDLQTLEHSLSSNVSKNYQEIWYCKKPVAKEDNLLVGRISFQNASWISCMDHSQMIEQVWNCSHREIEKWSPNSTTPFLRASRQRLG